MKVKKILCAAVSAAVCCSFFTSNVTADEFDTSNSSEIVVSAENEAADETAFSLGTLPNSYRLEDVENAVQLTNGITEEGGIAAYSNSAPVAGLKVILANSDSITPEGKATTDTVLYWVWNDGTNLYTYDPDGDAITERNLIGLHESMEGYITGNVTLGNEVVGFATQFTAAGEYIFDYYVKDSNGNQSNTVRYRNEVEPADGNKRPICSLKVKNGLNVIGIPVTFSLADSYDNDGSDSISGFTLQVDSGSGYQTLMQNDMQAFTNGISITFHNAGTYGIAASVIDNRNNRSDWVTGSITIGGGSVTLNSGEEWVDRMTVRTKPTGSNSYVYHTLTMRLGGGIVVDVSSAQKLRSYTNHNGTYYNVYMSPIPVGTLFLCADNRPASGKSGIDPVFYEETPRRITAEEIQYLDSQNYGYYIIYDSTGNIIDFYSQLNPLIASEWSIPGIDMED